MIYISSSRRVLPQIPRQQQLKQPRSQSMGYLLVKKNKKIIKNYKHNNMLIIRKDVQSGEGASTWGGVGVGLDLLALRVGSRGAVPHRHFIFSTPNRESGKKMTLKTRGT